ncbi:MAG: hypothetical protein KA715_10050 [Xanthomonadaceae bacterium]|nr:hypothetical protein [Xanthomonadaceae bacterium]
MRLRRSSILLLLFTTLSWAGGPKRILLIHGSVGMGHTAAAKGIAADLLTRDSTITIDIKDLRDFMSPLMRGVDNKAYDLLTQKFPWLYDQGFRDYMETGARASTLGNLPLGSMFNSKKVEKYIRDFNPNLIISTFPSATEVLVKLRDQGMLLNIPIGWVHTDLVDETYFAKMPLQIDMAFVGIPEIEQAWIKRGVPKDRVMTSGMPLNPKVSDPPNEAEIAKLRMVHNFDPKTLTILIMGGSNGVGDYPLMVKEVFKSFPDRDVQIIAVCGRNEKHYKDLNEMKKRLKPNQKILTTKLILQNELFAYMNIATGIISKTGGLTPMELFYRKKPLVFLDINGGQEKYNADVFSSVGLAELTQDQTQVGKLLKGLLEQPEKQSRQIQRQMLFCENNCPTKIADWVISAPQAKPMIHKTTSLLKNGDYPRPQGFFWKCSRALQKLKGL